LKEKYRRCKNGTDRESYILLRSRIKLAINSAYYDYIKNVSGDLARNPSNFWRFVNSKKNSSRLPHNMYVGDEILRDPQNIVNSFASYFSSFFSAKSTMPQKKGPFQNSYPSIGFKSVTLEEVIHAMKSLKGTLTAGEDQIPAFLIKDCSACLAPAMHKIINKILEYNYFPAKWKVSKITPVFKDGDKSDIHNYRPVALLSNFSKVFEIVLHKRIYSHCITVYF